MLTFKGPFQTKLSYGSMKIQLLHQATLQPHQPAVQSCDTHICARSESKRETEARGRGSVDSDGHVPGLCKQRHQDQHLGNKLPRDAAGLPLTQGKQPGMMLLISAASALLSPPLPSAGKTPEAFPNHRGECNSILLLDWALLWSVAATANSHGFLDHRSLGQGRNPATTSIYLDGGRRFLHSSLIDTRALCYE